MTAERRRKFWGWGYEGDGLSSDEIALLARALAERMGLPEVRALDPPEISQIELRPPRLAPPHVLRSIASTEPWDRAEHTLGKSYNDLVRGLRRHRSPVVAFDRGLAD